MQTVTIVLGTARDGRMSERVAHYLEQLFHATGTNCRFIDVRECVTVPKTQSASSTDDAGLHTWREAVEASNALIFVLPEYNHSYPGEWKLLIDSLSFDEYHGKHAYIAGVSAGDFGGARVIDHVKPVLVELGLVLHKTSLYVGRVGETLSADGEATDAAFRDRTDAFVATILTQIT
jgi:NAD(P)H-dependent FMN reductase